MPLEWQNEFLEIVVRSKRQRIAQAILQTTILWLENLLIIA
jgi:hypothetical protein